METINYYLKGFGFKNIHEYVTSTFGFMASIKVVSWSSIIGFISVFLKDYFGFSLMVFFAFVVLNILEFFTGVQASKKLGLAVESRKMGRMFLKIGTYLIIIWILNQFVKGFEIPKILAQEFNPFLIIYWAFLAGVIYQLYKSLLENLGVLGWKETRGILRYTQKKMNDE